MLARPVDRDDIARKLAFQIVVNHSPRTIRAIEGLPTRDPGAFERRRRSGLGCWSWLELAIAGTCDERLDSSQRYREHREDKVELGLG